MMQTAAKSPRPLWFKIFIGFGLSIMMLVAVVLILDIHSYGFTERRECGFERGFLGKLMCGVSETYGEWAPYFRSIPSDEEMIDNFHENRADFEKLVQIYREDLSVPSDKMGCLLPTSSLQTMMMRIKVRSGCGDGEVWMPPNPYSLEPDLLKSTAVQKARGGTQARKFSGVMFDYSHSKVKTMRYLGSVHRGYYYTPFVPRIEGGVMRKPSGTERMYAIPNSYPPIEYWGECVYRQIEGHWFISFCQDK